MISFISAGCGDLLQQKKSESDPGGNCFDVMGW